MSKATKRPARHTVRTTKSLTNMMRREFAQYVDSNGYLSWSPANRTYMLLGTNAPKKGLVRCPDCRIGELMVIRSRVTGKRFMGCSNFYGGCKASSPLLQKARLRATKQPCPVCKWPMTIFRYSRNQNWIKRCSNFKCASRA